MAAIFRASCCDIMMAAFNRYDPLGGVAMRDDKPPSEKVKQKVTKTILVIEDDVELAWILVQFFRQYSHYDTIWSHNGSEALQAMKNIKPDLLLLDYRLPDMNGLEFYDQLSTDDALATIPAILVTADTGRLQREVGRRRMIGIDKPFDLDTLHETINELLA